MKKKCRGCKQSLDTSSFNQSKLEPDGLHRLCRSCVNKRLRTRQGKAQRDREWKSAASSRSRQEGRSCCGQEEQQPDQRPQSAVPARPGRRDFKISAKKPSHVELVKFLIQLGANPIISSYVQRPSDPTLKS